MEQVELKPCPFCGGEAHQSVRIDEDLSTHNQVEWKTVECCNCEISFDWPDGYDCGTSAEQWNHRTTDQAKDEEIARLVDTMLEAAQDIANGTYFSARQGLIEAAARHKGNK